MKIAVYAISKNEEKFAERFCKSAADADEIIVGDTGSSDRTVEALQDAGADVIPVIIKPWRFDLARNAVLHSVSTDMDICIALDLDEVLMDGWRDHLETIYQNMRYTRLKYLFDWGKGHIFTVRKIHGRWGYHWKFPCHEYIVPDPRIKEVEAESNEILVKHYPDETKDRGHYLELLQATVEENPYCARSRFYLGREYVLAENHWAASGVLLQYLGMKEAIWNKERAYAMRLLGDCALKQNDAKQAEEWYRKGTVEAPEMREPWVALGQFLADKHRQTEALGAFDTALRVFDRESVYMSDPKCWDGSVERKYKELLGWVTTLSKTMQQVR